MVPDLNNFVNEQQVVEQMRIENLKNIYIDKIRKKRLSKDQAINILMEKENWPEDTAIQFVEEIWGKSQFLSKPRNRKNILNKLRYHKIISTIIMLLSIILIFVDVGIFEEVERKTYSILFFIASLGDLVYAIAKSKKLKD